MTATPTRKGVASGCCWDSPTSAVMSEPRLHVHLEVTPSTLDCTRVATVCAPGARAVPAQKMTGGGVLAHKRHDETRNRSDGNCKKARRLPHEALLVRA